MQISPLFAKKTVGFCGKEKQLNDFLIFPAPRCNRVTRPQALSHIQSILLVTLQNVRLFLREKGPNNDRKEPIKNSCFQNDSFFRTLAFPYIQVCNIPSPHHHQIGVLVRASGAQLRRIGSDHFSWQRDRPFIIIYTSSSSSSSSLWLGVKGEE